MTISINTSEYVKTKDVIIDGAGFKFSPLTTAQTAKLAVLQATSKKPAKQAEALAELLELLYSTFTPADKAREILGKLPVDAVMQILEKVSQDDE